MDTTQANILQWIFGDRRYFVRVVFYNGYLYYITCDHNEVCGEGFTLEEAMEMFINNWRIYNESGPY